jgi:hypothetical protein
MQPRSKRIGWPGRCRESGIVLALLCVSFSAAGCRSLSPPCVEQSTEALIEIATGQLEDHAPFVAAWEREQARACGWVTEDDFRDE